MSWKDIYNEKAGKGEALPVYASWLEDQLELISKQCKLIENQTKVVAIRHMANGNETVGEMWKETKIFDPEEPIENILQWAFDRDFKGSIDCRRSVTITVTTQ
jgi:hypothetical protein